MSFLVVLKKYRHIILLCLIFSILYLTLGIIRHNHFGSFGYDLGIVDQITWKFSQFKLPITTDNDAPFTLSLLDHFELIYAFVSPIYWIWDDVRSLIIFQAVFFSFSAVPVFLLASRYKLKRSLCYTLAICYLGFFGVQNALWFDVHSAPFGAAFLMWLIYFLYNRNLRLAAFTFLLCVTSKENYATYVVLLTGVFYLFTREKRYLFFAIFGIVYTALIFGFYYPHIVKGGYHYTQGRGLFTGFNLLDLINTSEKQQVFFYGLLSFGFLPVLAPLYLIPFFGNLTSYFILGRAVSTAQGLFLQYRIDLAPLLVIPAIIALSRSKFFNKSWLVIYLLGCILAVQYLLHLPLSYLTKKWFWTEPAATKSINAVLPNIPKNASVVAQNNILPHLSHRDEIFTLWPRKEQVKGLVCPKIGCNWLVWAGKPTYLIVDTSNEWDIRHFLGDPQDFKDALVNVEKRGFITPYKKIGTTTLYKIVKQPN